MDFSTMRDKIDRHVYRTIDDLNEDFQLIINNCLTYNERDSPLHKLALVFRVQVNRPAHKGVLTYENSNIIWVELLLPYGVDTRWVFHGHIRYSDDTQV